LQVKTAVASVCVAPWPNYPVNFTEFPVEATIAQWQEKITVLRNLRAERNVPPAAKIRPIILARGEAADLLRRGTAHIRNLAGAESVQIVESAERPAESAVAVLADAEVILPLEGLIDKQSECAKLRKSLSDLERQLAPLRAKLANEAFISRAPADVVEAQRTKLAELEAQRTAVADLIAKDCPG
jgi:valyl-tRNA synthetase